MFDLVLYQPEIPPNTGNIIRLCANIGARLHLIHPLGFTLDDAALKRAGLDYHEWVGLTEHEDLSAYLTQVKPQRLFLCSSKGTHCYSDVNYQAGDAFLFGSETKGVPAHIFESFTEKNRLKIPMHAQSRCLNLANAAAVILYEAWRQIEFKGARF